MSNWYFDYMNDKEQLKQLEEEKDGDSEKPPPVVQQGQKWKIFFHRFDEKGIYAGGVLPYEYTRKWRATARAKKHFANAPYVGWCVSQVNPFPDMCRNCDKDCMEKECVKSLDRIRERNRLKEFSEAIAKHLKKGHAAQTYVLLDEKHGVNVCMDEAGNNYIVSACGFDYGSGDVFDLREWGRIPVGDSNTLEDACLYVLNTRFPGWDELM